MDAKVCYEENVDTIKAIPEKSLIKLNMPKEEVVAEANQLGIVANGDSGFLIARGLKEESLTQLPVRTAAFTDAAVRYETNCNGASEYEEKWEEAKKVGYNMVKKLNSEFEFAFRNNNSALKDLAEVKEGKGIRVKLSQN